jgi:hypothetical protein
MTAKDKTEYMRIGLALCNIPCDDYHAEMIWRLFEGIQHKKGRFALSDAASIRAMVQKKHNKKKVLPKVTSTSNQPKGK